VILSLSHGENRPGLRRGDGSTLLLRYPELLFGHDNSRWP